MLLAFGVVAMFVWAVWIRERGHKDNNNNDNGADEATGSTSSTDGSVATLIGALQDYYYDESGSG